MDGQTFGQSLLYRDARTHLKREGKDEKEKEINKRLKRSLASFVYMLHRGSDSRGLKSQ